MSIGNWNSENITKQTTYALWASFIVLAGLIIGGFITPPPGQIPDSLQKVLPWPFSIAVLAVIREAVKEGRGAKITHGNTVIEVNKDDDGNE